MNEIQQKKIQRSRLSLVLLALVFILPIAAAWIISKNKALQPAQTKNEGNLIEPVRPLADFKVNTVSGEEFTLEDLRRKWSIVLLTDNSCNAACRETLLKVRDARFAQSGEAIRVQYYLVYTAQPDVKNFADLQQDHPRLVGLVFNAETQKVLLDQFRLENEADPVQAHRLYLIDPIGNLMMYYPQGFPGNGLLKDLRHLLHWSQIG